MKNINFFARYCSPSEIKKVEQIITDATPVIIIFNRVASEDITFKEVYRFKPRSNIFIKIPTVSEGKYIAQVNGWEIKEIEGRV